MLSRVAYKRQPGRRLLTAIAGTALIVGSFVAGSSVLAVNATGAFELDGNAITSHAGTGSPDDWDRACYSQQIKNGATVAAATAACFGNNDPASPTGLVGATAFSWIDSTNSLEIYTGGGSKDPNDPQNSWLWKAADTVPDKDTILHAFSARYSLTPNSSTCPSNGAATCEVIFFGDDRFDNSGDAQLGFWFFKNKVTTTNIASGGGLEFSGHHQNGDLLVLSDFSNGGVTSSIAVYFWDTTCGSDNTAANKIYSSPQVGFCGANNLRLQANSASANCATSAPTAAFCGIANPDLATSANAEIVPWAYKDKKGNTKVYDQNEFYESGINLSSLGLGSSCFSSFLAESRSSQSPTATLKDFVLGNFQNCGAIAATTPSSTSVSPGSSVTDTLTVTGSGTASPPFPSSPPNAVFSMCGPIASGICDSSDTAHTPTQFDTEALAPTTTQGVSSATSTAVNTSASPLTPGRYCFVGSWAGDSNYPGTISDNSTGECFTVITIPTTTVTTPSDSSGTALGTNTLALGTQLYDKAVVTGTTVGGNPPGTVNFFICDPSQVTGSGSSALCADGTGTALTGNPRTLVADSGSNPPTSSVLSSPAVNANAAGVWCFRATYVPSGTTYTGSSDATHDECVTVGPENTTTVTTPSISGSATLASGGTSVTDHAVVTAVDNADGTPTGTVTFYLCDPSTVTTNGGNCSTGGTQVGTAVTLVAVANSNPPASSADSSSALATSVGTWCFRAVYTPGGTNGANYNGSSDGTSGECFTITDSTTSTSAQTWLPNDSASVSATGGSSLSGTISIQLYSDATCGTSGGSAVAGQLYSNPVSGTTGTVTSNNSTYKVSASSSVSWLVTFVSSDSNVAGSTHCESTTLTVNN